MVGHEIHISVIALPEGLRAPVTGVCEAFETLRVVVSGADENPAPLRIEIVGPAATVTGAASGGSIPPCRDFEAIARTDVVIVPSIARAGGPWQPGRQGQAVAWLRAMHAGGARLYGAGTGTLLLAETGLLDGREAAIHPALLADCRALFPAIRVRRDARFIESGDRGEIVTCASGSRCHDDLVLHWVEGHAGPALAGALARALLVSWAGSVPDVRAPFAPRVDHADRAIRAAQAWANAHYRSPGATAGMRRASGLCTSTFKRRFRQATGHRPVDYIQHLRIEDARRRLIEGALTVDAVGWAVGYENVAFFRRLFKRMTGLTPGRYRRRFRAPGGSGVPHRPVPDRRRGLMDRRSALPD